MAIPPLNRQNVEQALELLAAQLDQIAEGPHNSTTYDLMWNGLRFPPKVAISKAVELQHGYLFPESEFSGGEDPGHANDVLRELGFEIVPKGDIAPALPLKLHERYAAKKSTPR